MDTGPAQVYYALVLRRVQEFRALYARANPENLSRRRLARLHRLLRAHLAHLRRYVPVEEGPTARVCRWLVREYRLRRDIAYYDPRQLRTQPLRGFTYEASLARYRLIASVGRGLATLQRLYPLSVVVRAMARLVPTDTLDDC